MRVAGCRERRECRRRRAARSWAARKVPALPLSPDDVIEAVDRPTDRRPSFPASGSALQPFESVTGVIAPASKPSRQRQGGPNFARSAHHRSSSPSAAPSLLSFARNEDRRARFDIWSSAATLPRTMASSPRSALARSIPSASSRRLLSGASSPQRRRRQEDLPVCRSLRQRAQAAAATLEGEGAARGPSAQACGSHADEPRCSAKHALERR